MVRSAEGPLAQVAAERFLAGVFPVVPGQLVGSGELPRAPLPGALVGLLPCKKKHVVTLNYVKNKKKKKTVGSASDFQTIQHLRLHRSEFLIKIRIRSGSTHSIDRREKILDLCNYMGRW